MSADWPFSEPQNVATLVSRYIFQGEPILYAYRDWDDGTWQFFPDRVTEPSHVLLVALKEVYALDQSIGDLSDLPPGWMAHRSTTATPWERRKNHPFPVFADHGFYLEDATEYERQRPDLYCIPDAETRENLNVGDTVKLIFRFAEEWSDREDNDAERMWVEVTEVDRENACYRGTLANDPIMHSQIACGDELWFHPIHVFDIYAEPNE
jgi:hypothetical protein